MAEEPVHMLPQGDLVFTQKPPVISNYTPKSVDDHIDVLEFGHSGQLFLATSSLNKRSWTGDLWWFGSPEDAPQADKAFTGYRIDSGIAQAKVINSKQLVLGLDSGALQLVSTNTSSHETRDTLHHFFDMLPSYCEHDDRISDLDTWPDHEKDQILTPELDKGGRSNMIVTGGMDGRVIVWDKNMCISNLFSPAHPSGVISVACNKSDNQIFGTAGMDGKIKVWNLRNIKSCTTVYSDEMEPPAAISWVPGHPHTLLVASRTGKVLLLDTETKLVRASLLLMDREIRTMRWSVDRPDLCAVAGDDVQVHVIKVEESAISKHYSNQSHKDFVRGLAWHPTSGDLWSSGWDKQVIKHTVPR